METFGATSGTRWTLRYAQILPIRIRQIGFRVHVRFVNVSPARSLERLGCDEDEDCRRVGLGGACAVMNKQLTGPHT